MKALILYDSFFGNTEQIARAIAGAIGDSQDVRVARVGETSPDDLKGFEIVVLGSPTRGFRASEAIQAFIQNIPDAVLKGKKVAAFDTRMPEAEVGKGLRLLMKMGGYAAPRIAKELQKKGGNLVVPPEGFFVKDREGPLKEGELERAAEWGKKIDKIET